jgi:benzoate membrane transport protein
VTNWFKISHISAGFITVLISYTSSAVIIFQAAEAAGAGPAELDSWLWALGIGMGATCIGLSLYYRNPIVSAWSTPGAALLATSLSGLSMNQAIGAFLFSSLLITVCGATGWFQKLMRYIPKSIAAAMLAGILIRFGMDLFTAMQSQLLLAALMFAVFMLGRLFLPRYAVALAFATGIAVAAALHLLHMESVTWGMARPAFTWPSFSFGSVLGVGIPLFIVTMASQNVPGLAVLRAHGYQTPASPLIGWTGLTGLALGAFGGFSYNLAAITAAICMSDDVDDDPAKRYRAAIWAGIFYLLAGIFGATVVSFFAAFPQELIAAIAGLALLGTIGGSLVGAVAEESGREAALVTFIATASGFSLFGIGSAFWGMVLGMLVYVLTRRVRKN